MKRSEHGGSNLQKGKRNRHESQFYCRWARQDLFLGVGQDEIIALWFELKPHVISDNRMLKFSFIALQEFRQISASVADSVLFVLFCIFI